MASEFYSGQLIFISNLALGQVVKKVNYMNYHGYKNSGIRYRYAVIKKKLHYHSSICLQVVEEVRKSLNQPKKQKKAHT
jgi:hypothetical protein